MAIFTGCATAIITPFNEDGSIDFSSLKSIIEFQIENKVDAIVSCGTTGEASALTDEEQLEVIRFTAEAVNKRVPVIAGCGSNDTNHGIRLTQACSKLNIDGLLHVTPYYNKTTQKGLIYHFEAMASNTDLPVVLYNVPSRTGMNIEPKTALELSNVKNIVGIKEASGNISQIASLAALTRGKLDLYSGNDDQIVPILSLGGIGVISVLSNPYPRQTHDMVMKYLEGDRESALSLQLNLLDAVDALFCEVNPIPVKAAMHILGYSKNIVRGPLVPMSDANYDKLQAIMKTITA